MKKWFSILIAGATAMGLYAAKPFVPDANTLLLAGFDNGVERADYSIGPAHFMGIGAQQDAGYYGKGINLRQRFPHPDINHAGDARAPMFIRWSMLMHGNIRPEEGTFEFFVKLRRPATSPVLMGNGMVTAFVGRFTDDGGYYTGASIHLTCNSLTWRLPLWSRDSRDNWQGKVNFKEKLAENWHHFALVWSKGEAVIYLDGRAVSSCDLSGKLGVVLLNNLQDGLCMAGFVFDEIRISDTARYRNDFEPNWRDGKRPEYAYKGNPDVKRYPASYRTPPQAEKLSPHPLPFAGSDAALTLFDNFDRQKLDAEKVQSTDDKNFSQLFSLNGKTVIAAKGRATVLPSGTWLWDVEFTNQSAETRRIEALLGIEIPFSPRSVFDGLDTRTSLALPRYRDSYAMVLPLTAAADDRRFIACGISPRFPYNDLVFSWHPGNVLMQGTKFELAPGEKFTVTYYLATGKSAFGTAAALDRYYSDFSDLYKQHPEASVYDYLPVTTHWRGDPPRDIQRQCFAGSYWGHGPYHTKGDGSGRFWNMEKYKNEKSYRHALSWEKLMQKPENIPTAIAIENRFEFDRGIAVRRYHATPDLTPEWIIKEIDPQLKHTDDPLTTGHYYKRINGNYFVNEYNTPLGKMFLEETGTYLKNTRNCSPGFINDVIYADSVMRFFDNYAQKSSGRSFSPDFGAFIRGAMGKWQRWNFTKNLKIQNRYPGSWVADGGGFSFTLGAASCQTAVESRHLYSFLSGLSYLKYSRQLHGEKSLSGHTSSKALDIDRYIDAGMTSPGRLREILRFTEQQLILFCLEHAVLPDPGAYPAGKQKIMEYSPLITEATMRGRKAVPGGWINQPLWLRRSGEGVKSLLIAGNRQNRTVTAKITLDNTVFGGMPLPFVYMGGKVNVKSDREQKTHFAPEIPARTPGAWLTAVILADPGKCSAETEISGDGINFRLTARINAEKSTAFTYDKFSPLYRSSVKVNGRESRIIPAGKSLLTVDYSCIPLKFTAQDVQALELFKSGKVNFRIAADPGWRVNWLYYRNMPLGFDRGTAALLEDFVTVYDWENGIHGDIGSVKWVKTIDPAYPGWHFVLKSDAQENGAAIDPVKRLITVNGTTPGEARRVMMIFMRMIDRRYPHIGPQVPLKYGSTVYSFANPFELKGNTAAEKAFREKFRNANIFGQPLLESKYEHLYSPEADFTGCYKLSFPPFICEPSYADDFVHGYKEDDAEWKKLLETHPGIKRVGL